MKKIILKLAKRIIEKRYSSEQEFIQFVCVGSIEGRRYWDNHAYITVNFINYILESNRL